MKTKNYLRSIFAVILCTALSYQGQAQEDGWTELFNGKDLKGWEQYGGKAKYRVEDGCIVGQAVRIQQMFGATETPTVAGGRVKVLLHLLAPHGRPQQVTDDLPSFWANTWAQVRKDLRARYPKHAWPEKGSDPFFGR